MNDLLFVYGSLRRGNQNAMADFLATHADFVCHGWYQGKMFMISDYPGVIPSDDPNDRVVGEVYCLRDAQSVLTRLDAYEECSALHPQPAEYQRVLVSIETPGDLVKQQVWLFLYQWTVSSKIFIQSGDFMQPMFSLEVS